MSRIWYQFTDHSLLESENEYVEKRKAKDINNFINILTFICSCFIVFLGYVYLINSGFFDSAH